MPTQLTDEELVAAETETDSCQIGFQSHLVASAHDTIIVNDRYSHSGFESLNTLRLVQGSAKVILGPVQDTYLDLSEKNRRRSTLLYSSIPAFLAAFVLWILFAPALFDTFHNIPAGLFVTAFLGLIFVGGIIVATYTKRHYPAPNAFDKYLDETLSDSIDLKKHIGYGTYSDAYRALMRWLTSAQRDALFEAQETDPPSFKPLLKMIVDHCLELEHARDDVFDRRKQKVHDEAEAIAADLYDRALNG